MIAGKWVSVEDLRAEGIDLSDKEFIVVRFPRGWWCNNPPGGLGRFIPQGLERPNGDAPVMSWSGKFYPKYNPSDERTIYDHEFPGTWLSRLPKTAQINMGKGWELEKAERKAKRENLPPPSTLSELRQRDGVQVGDVPYGTSASGGKLLADTEELNKLQKEVEELRAFVKAEQEKKMVAQARMAKARAAKKKPAKE